ncbi:FAD-binding oxidoreductase [Rhodobacteraceae bacterium CCMM004]|nr:FAD-binding oxidoreductase [Rhodobacteraceae bacterium CCMM004]
MAETGGRILVAGAGIVGISCAIWLQRAGYAVTVVDREGPAAGASEGNAGLLAAAAVVPVTVPGLARKAPRMLLDPESPLFLRWTALPRLAPFLLRYLKHGTDGHVAHASAALATLLHDTVAQHRALAEDTPAAAYIHDADYCVGYARAADFDADAYAWRVRARAGMRYEVMTGAAYARIDPVWGDTFETVVRCPGHGRISDPGAYVRALAQQFEDRGGTLLRADLRDVERTAEGDVTALVTSEGRLAADRIVLALGAWSGPLAARLGLHVPMESERGYHLEFWDPSEMPLNPMMVAAGKFVLTPMEGRLRAAGVVEYGGLRAGPSPAPLALLRRQVRRALPGLTATRETTWMGHRPVTADSLPLIGPAAADGAYCAFGHQHVGLTAGPKTGRLIADMVRGAAPNLDLAPFAPDRFAR